MLAGGLSPARLPASLRVPTDTYVEFPLEPGELAQQIAKLAETVELHDDQIKTIADVLKQMMAQPPKPRELGFHTVRSRAAPE